MLKCQIQSGERESNTILFSGIGVEMAASTAGLESRCISYYSSSGTTN